jgi:hypothetical protein
VLTLRRISYDGAVALNNKCFEGTVTAQGEVDALLRAHGRKRRGGNNNDNDDDGNVDDDDINDDNVDGDDDVDDDAAAASRPPAVFPPLTAKPLLPAGAELLQPGDCCPLTDTEIDAVYALSTSHSDARAHAPWKYV